MPIIDKTNVIIASPIFQVPNHSCAVAIYMQYHALDQQYVPRVISKFPPAALWQRGIRNMELLRQAPRYGRGFGLCAGAFRRRPPPGYMGDRPPGAGNSAISMGNAQGGEWLLVISLSYPRQALSGVCVQWPRPPRARHACANPRPHGTISRHS